MEPPIFVTKPFLPPKEEYLRYVSGIYERGILTNQGPLVHELENKLREFLGVQYLHYLCNGTVALQLALAALDINEGEVITTPFSYVATVSAILWQRCKPVFVDIEPYSYTIDISKIETAITSQTKAILPVHVFGYPCDVAAIQEIAEKHNLKVIYDAAHAFGSKVNGRSLLEWGDVSALSFHATKLFHTIEGGACVTSNRNISEKIELQKRFGHNQDEHIMLGINAKTSEFNAAMGLANFPYLEMIIDKRKRISEQYDAFLDGIVLRPAKAAGLEYNYAYYPVVFESEVELLQVFKALAEERIYPRRYFYPSLNILPYVKSQACPVSEDVAKRIACLPFSTELSEEDTARICKTIKMVV
jgi:dTDP-4-amino-4,6-dideoxygalactose transaminase